QQRDFTRGLQAVEEALERIAATDECHMEAESLRVRGELLLQRSVQNDNPDADQEAAEACFQQALQVARRQQAKSLELRAATSLARLWQATSRSAEAKQLLASLYAWFSEGFDTPDLQTAQALIVRL
ncbi:MAG: hypothetical protein KDI62_18540, partial [Anaerolineae bacterium]|nr:hypothetical protein [Anaerolineae bacterium]